jgi:hypothetical protein
MRLTLTAALVAAGLCLLAGVAQGAVTTATHTTYALRPCSTCREIRYPTEAECEAAALAEAVRVGTTRTTGGAVYTCITRYNVIATFSVGNVGRAVLSWTPPTQNTNGSTLNNLAGYRISYGTSPEALAQTVQIANPGVSSYTISNLAPGTYYFAVRAYATSDAESVNSNVISKTVP